MQEIIDVYKRQKKFDSDEKGDSNLVEYYWALANQLREVNERKCLTAYKNAELIFSNLSEDEKATEHCKNIQ